MGDNSHLPSQRGAPATSPGPSYPSLPTLSGQASRPRTYASIVFGRWHLPKARRPPWSRRGIVPASAIVLLLMAALVAWWITSPFAPYAIPRPTFAFSFCVTPLWARTQAGPAFRLGNCMGELYSPADGNPLPVITIPQGSTFALGCMPGECPTGTPGAASSRPSVVARRGVRNGEIYFKAVSRGVATIEVQGFACIVANLQERLTGSCPALVVRAG